VWEDLRTLPDGELKSHFPNISNHCIDMGYDPEKVCIPVVPAQHYFMGGIKVNHESKTSMDALYAVGETACNGVHGRNRLASNSLLESLVFAKRAAQDITATKPHEMSESEKNYFDNFNIENYADESKLDKEYADLVNGKIAEANLAEGENYV
jgi:L-aspartate oxidase